MPLPDSESPVSSTTLPNNDEVPASATEQPLDTETPEALESTPVSDLAVTPIPESMVKGEVSVPVVVVCPSCQALRKTDATFCDDCGLVFPAPLPSAEVPPQPVTWGKVIGGRYQLGEVISERGGVIRFRGTELAEGERPATAVLVLRQVAPEPKAIPEVLPPTRTVTAEDFDFSLGVDSVLTGLDSPTGEYETELITRPAGWPALDWEKQLLELSHHPTLPRVLDCFEEEGFCYLIVEQLTGQSFWDAWDADDCTWQRRCTWLIQIAEALETLHQGGAILEGLRPEMLAVNKSNQAVLTNLADLLPIPFPSDAPIRAGYYSAPELVLHPESVTTRADLYCFGAMLQAMLLGRELSDLDFTLQGRAKSYLERCPDVHPHLGRVLTRTFARDPELRFPTEESLASDPSGIRELIGALELCRTDLDRVRLDIAGWSTIGMVRAGNEDAFALLRGAESGVDDSADTAVLVLADGMGGMESGEVAAGLTVGHLLSVFRNRPPLLRLAPTHIEPAKQEFDSELRLRETQTTPTPNAEPESIEARTKRYSEQIAEALVQANRLVFDTARRSPQHRGMGCTAEVVLIDDSIAVVGHVGDSRVYHVRKGKWSQVTRDQTVVARLVELGHLSEAEAATHARRSELQQAIGGRYELFPDIYSLILQPGDWLIVCSDGLSNQLSTAQMDEVLRESGYAERAARRLVNLANLEGAADNTTVIVVRAQ